MNNLQRFGNVFGGLFTLLAGLFFLLLPEDGSYAIAWILAISLFLMGLRLLVYYFSMAKLMVGGKIMMLIGVFLLDFSVFTLLLFDEPRIYIILYLAGWHAFLGAIALLRAREARRYKGSWKLKTANGIVNLMIAAGCFLFMKNEAVLVYIYGGGLVYSGLMRIISAFRKTQIVYIQ